MRLCRDLARSQFVFANPKRTQRLWDEAAALEIEPDRLLNLSTGRDLENPADLIAADELFLGQRLGYRRSPWVSRILPVRRRLPQGRLKPATKLQANNSLVKGDKPPEISDWPRADLASLRPNKTIGG